ncbi:MAG: energy transducer TonB [Bacteroidetes bacterium]|jgi:periplasmic protein TonB|nr:energy transducer TonB [Bacteroidota bacterium]MBT5530108.1 energy transducer TonB [Cytophagia bacterium]MBT3800729.1 energy transducer TonB [Bacteroidota bacterium]MBT3934873.1 energy transducer TonB [Bacteroidota bacterium]MBT4726965.1 energy transducer TonB [Bacteroidota bacterium]
MRSKKEEKVDVDKKSGLYFRMGLSAALIIVILAFQWKVYDRQSIDLDSNLIIDEEEEIIDITKQEKKPPPPPPPPELEIVEDDVEIEENNPEIKDVEIKEDEAIELAPIEETKEEVVEEQIFYMSEDPPSFPGGDKARNQYLRESIRYPDIERDNGIQGPVVVNFVVEKDGSINNVKILKGLTPNINEEAIRVVKDMPRWVAGKQRGKPVRVYVNLPIRFTLN